MHAARSHPVTSVVGVFPRIFCILAVAACAWAQTAASLYKEGRKAEDAGRLVQAYVLFSEAAALDPTNQTYANRSALLQSLAERHAVPEPSAEPETPDPAFDSITGSISPLEMQETRRLLPPPRLALPPGDKSFDLRGDSKLLFQQIAQNCGLTLIWELDYQPTPAFHFELAAADCRTALRAAEDASNSFIVPFSEDTILVSRDTPQKRTELEPVVAKAIPIPERASIQEVQEVVVAIQQSLEIRRIVVDPQKRLIFLLDRASKARVAQRLLAEMVGYRPQVVIELDYLSVDKSKSLTWGATLQKSFPLVNFANVLNAMPSIPSGFTNFLSFGGGQTLFGIGIAEAAAFATVTKSIAKTSLKTQVMALDGQETALHVGQRYPILTNGYFGNTTGTGQVYTPPPTFNFEDLGLVLKIKPSVHSRDDVTLVVDAEFKVLGTGTLNGIPVIDDRKFQGTVRLMTGEWAVITGLMTKSGAKTYSGFPGLDHVPLFRDLFGQNTRDLETSDVLLVIKPQVISVPPEEQLTRAIWVGTESRFLDFL